MRLAFMTFGVLREPWGSPGVRGFEDRLDATFAASDRAPGLLDRYDDDIDDFTMPDDDPRWGRWGPYRLPSVYPGVVTDLASTREAVTLSIWRDIDSVFAFAYGGLHIEALRRRSDWFEARRWPTYVAWWIGDDDQPTWAEATARLDRLHAEGPTPEAFDFHRPFDALGRPLARPGRPRGASTPAVDPSPG